MTPLSTRTLEDAIRHSGEGWLLDLYTPAAKALDFLRQQLVRVAETAQVRLGENAPDLSESAVIELHSRYPLKVKAFFQVLGVTRTPDMLLMAWRIIQGMEIKDVEMDYSLQKVFHMRVTLASPYGEEDEAYETSVIQDFAIFRHVGIMEVSGKPVFDGFYPLKIK